MLNFGEHWKEKYRIVGGWDNMRMYGIEYEMLKVIRISGSEF